MSTEDSSKKSANVEWRIKSWFPELNTTAQDRLKKYFAELLKFNKTINLISQKTEQTADLVHFADSILASRIVYKNINNNNMLYDIGSGNGFPGIVFAILFPEQKITLVDSDERKCEFLKHIVKMLSLVNVTVLSSKIENLPPDSIQQAICRGFAPIPKAILSLRKLLAKGGVVFHLKSDEWALEISQIPTQLCSFWKPDLVDSYSLPAGDKVKLFIVKTEKIA